MHQDTDAVSQSKEEGSAPAASFSLDPTAVLDELSRATEVLTKALRQAREEVQMERIRARLARITGSHPSTHA